MLGLREDKADLGVAGKLPGRKRKGLLSETDVAILLEQ